MFNRRNVSKHGLLESQGLRKVVCDTTD